MKRSQMLKLIEGLFDIAPRFPNDMNAENLLCHLEESGMKPPGISKQRETKWFDAFGYEHSGLVEYTENKWEPE